MNSKATEPADREWTRSMQKVVTTALILCIVATSGCARLNSIYRNKPIGDEIQSVSIDAKQRMVFSAQHIGDNDEMSRFRVLCAEPSPDVFSAFAASLSSSVKTESIEAALQGAFSENSATIGLRTQVIQLLRDGMYRICEGVISNQLSEDEFYSLHQRYQRIMVTLVAIEQLTGAVTPPPITIQTDSLAGRPARLPQLQSDLEEAEEQLASAESSFAEFEEEPEKVEDACDELSDDEEKTECRKYYAAKNKRDEKQATVDSLEEAIKIARSEVVHQASGQVFVSTAFQRDSAITEKAAIQISDTVRDLVDSLWEIDFDTVLKKFETFGCHKWTRHPSFYIDLSERIETQISNLNSLSNWEASAPIQQMESQLHQAEASGENAIAEARQLPEFSDDPDMTANQLAQKAGEAALKSPMCRALVKHIEPKVQDDTPQDDS